MDEQAKIAQREPKKERRSRVPRDTYDLSTVHGRLAYTRAQIYPTASAAARENGWVIATTGQHENGTRPLTIDSAIKYAAAYGTTLDYLFLGKEGTGIDGITLNPLALQATPRIDLSDIEALAAFADEKRGMSNRTLPVPPKGGQPTSNKIFIKMTDDSMEWEGNPNSIKEGDDVELDAYEPWRPGNFVVAIVEGHPTGIVRQYSLVSFDPPIIELKPLNKHYPVVRIENEKQGKIVARVTRRLTEL